MMSNRFWLALLLCFSFQMSQADSELAPAVPDLMLPVESEPAIPAEAAVTQKAVPAKPAAQPRRQAAASRRASAKKAPAAAAKAAEKQVSRAKAAVAAETAAAATVNTEKIEVENLMAQAASPAGAAVAAQPASSAPAVPAAASAQKAAPSAAPAAAKTAAKKGSLVEYNPPTDRDPTLSPDDTLLLKHREEERLRALEAERQRKIDEERRRLAELERQRQLELERLRDPSREVRGKIRVNGIIGQEAFIGNKIYSVGQSVLGARIVSIQPDAVVFTYKGQQFTKRVELK